MKKQQLNEEFIRMQRLAGIINEIKINEPNTLLNQQKSRVKEWLELCFDGEEIDPETEEEVDSLLNNANEMTEELFKEIWAVYVEEHGSGDIGADWDAFDITFKWVMDGDESHFDNY